MLAQDASFNLNLMNYNGEQLHIPETEYASTVTMPSGDFSRICRELQQISENGTPALIKSQLKPGKIQLYFR